MKRLFKIFISLLTFASIIYLYVSYYPEIECISHAFSSKTKIEEVKAGTINKLTIIYSHGLMNHKQEKKLQAKLASVFKVPVEFGMKKIDVSDSYNVFRHQFNVDQILMQFKSNHLEQSRSLNFYLIDEDIYAPCNNYLFGLYDPEHNNYVMSINRLLPSDYGALDDSLFIERVYKLILRRVGFALGLESDQCVMKYSNSLSELDAIHSNYCPEDAQTLREKKILR